MNKVQRLFKSALSLFKRAELMTVVFSAASALMVTEQITYTLYPDVRFGPESQDQNFRLSLWQLNRRATELAGIKDPIVRDEHCIPTSAFARRLDRRLPADARIFVSGLIGTNNGSRDTTYFFLRNYLFPRDIEISLDGRAVQTEDGFEGIPCESRDELRKRGFDVLIRFQTNNTIAVSPLTPKGVLK